MGQHIAIGRAIFSFRVFRVFRGQQVWARDQNDGGMRFRHTSIGDLTDR